MAYLVLAKIVEFSRNIEGPPDKYESVDEILFDTKEEVEKFIKSVKLYAQGKKVLTKGPKAGIIADMTEKDRERLHYQFDYGIQSIYMVSDEVSDIFL